MTSIPTPDGRIAINTDATAAQLDELARYADYSSRRLAAVQAVAEVTGRERQEVVDLLDAGDLMVTLAYQAAAVAYGKAVAR